VDIGEKKAGKKVDKGGLRCKYQDANQQYHLRFFEDEDLEEIGQTG
jgi:hypothetical protein